MRNRRCARMLEEPLPQSMGGRARPACDSGVFSTAGSKGPFRLVLVRTLPDLASHLEIEEPSPDMAQSEADLRTAMRCSRGGMTRAARRSIRDRRCGVPPTARLRAGRWEPVRAWARSRSVRVSGAPLAAMTEAG